MKSAMENTILLPHKEARCTRGDGENQASHFHPSLTSTLKILHLASSGEQGLEMTVICLFEAVLALKCPHMTSLHFHLEFGLSRQMTGSRYDCAYLKIHLDEKCCFHPSRGHNQSGASGSSLMGSLGESQPLATCVSPLNLMESRIFIISLNRCLPRTDDTAGTGAHLLLALFQRHCGLLVPGARPCADTDTTDN